MSPMKTPGVYIVEKNAFPHSVIEVATAIPAFVGYTEKAVEGMNSLLNKPTKINSMGEFLSFFGSAPKLKFRISKEQPATKEREVINVRISANETYHLTVPPIYSLYYNMLLFYANGGGPCYVVSVGTYDDHETPDKESLEAGIRSLCSEQEPTLLVIPEAVNLPEVDCYSLQQAMLNHCGNVMKNRFAILDVRGGTNLDNDAINGFRQGIGNSFLGYGAVYFPWLESSILSLDAVTWEHIDNWESWLKEASKELNTGGRQETSLVEVINNYFTNKKAGDSLEESNQQKNNLHQILLVNWPLYKTLLSAIQNRLNLLPPSAAMAGLYTMVDNTRGVWKAPANISVSNVISPSVTIDNKYQEDLNIPLDGKSINAIRSFIGEGIKVWGARTLDGNSLDWRYLHVRRTMIFLEVSIKNAARSFVFEPNDANTWINLKSMLENFLRNVWKRGGLAGATPEDAYSVHIGLGDTMTPEDILDGILRVTVLVAITHPAEFIEITFKQKMQKS